MSRSHALLAGARLPLTATVAATRADMRGATSARINRFKLGGFEVTALLGGTRTVEKPTCMATTSAGCRAMLA